MPNYETSWPADRDRQQSKSKVEQPWRIWFKSPTWKAVKRHRLGHEPHCRCCAQEGRTVTATQVGHVEPHFGRWSLFIKYENTQSLCARHHRSRRQPTGLVARLLAPVEGQN
jgi:hypothetical protein